MYPEINALVSELHKRRISTFLVTNAQFPDRIKQVGVLGVAGIVCSAIVSLYLQD